MNVSAASDFQWTGFGTIGLGFATNESVVGGGEGLPYNNFTSKLSETVDTKFGVQGNVNINDKSSATVQLISRARDDYEPKIEWANLTYQATSKLQFRLGRTRRPFFQFSDSIDIGYSYSWIRPPAINYYEFGPLHPALYSFDMLLDHTVGEWGFSGQAYVGRYSGSGEPFRARYIYEEWLALGAAAQASNDSLSFRLSYHLSFFAVDEPQFIENPNALNPFDLDQDVDEIVNNDALNEFRSIGASKRYNSWIVSGEITSARPKQGLLPSVDSWYVHLQKSVGSFVFHYTHGNKTTNDKFIDSQQINSSELLGPQNNLLPPPGAPPPDSEDLGPNIRRGQTDRTTNIVGVRFDFHPAASLKFEFERVDSVDVGSSSDIISFSTDFLF